MPFKLGTLGTWVISQRTQYRLVKDRKTSSMTDEHVQSWFRLGFSGLVDLLVVLTQHGMKDLRNFNLTRPSRVIAMCPLSIRYWDVG